ncbi:DUF1365 domain-containing protein [Agarilytica rhodophyticola]|uniref:DUF1365 domain-containing protein n=1 Tax=Agarilytica rhodophyticola TaxID=1737490 RepID=UPI000B341CBC|nr:DUF1365 domain-containing protein [Agarilytica rhodophyticola]
MKSAIYTGNVRHRRFSPKCHEFNYNVFMLYVSLDELDDVLKLSPLWSKSAFGVARFKREDFHGDPKRDLSDCVKQTVADKLGREVTGDVRVLANFRYFNFNMNPLTTYYCFDESGENLQAILAEVNNTPWNERHAYVLDMSWENRRQRVFFDKVFTVSPFNPLDMHYQWKSTTPDQLLHLHIDTVQNNQRITDATLRLKREPITKASLNLILLRYPLMTLKVFTAIYWQAFCLFIKGVPFLGKNAMSGIHKKEQTGTREL